MPTLPIPLFGALVLAFLLAALLRRDDHGGFLPALLAACAVQGLIISLAQHYQFPLARSVQPITAALIPALAWISFQGTAIRGARWTYDIWHALGPLFTLFCLIKAPAWLDVFIPVLYIGYGSAILLTLLKGADALPRLRLGTGDMPVKLWRIIGMCLIVSALSDVLIVSAQMMGRESWQPWIITVFSSGTLVLLGALTLSDTLNEPEKTEPVAVSPIDALQNETLMQRLDDLMEAQQLYLNPDLTLTQLARRLHVPVKQLSIAINRKTGENVSRYINKYRIDLTCEKLLAGESVTTAMLSAGFNTKSNFNREFLRNTGQAPSDWLRKASNGQG